MSDLATLSTQRRAIRHLLDPTKVRDARADYYAFEYAESKTTLVTHHPERIRAVGYVCFSRTGMDLFRPFVTMRLPSPKADAKELLERAFPSGSSAIASVSALDRPLMDAVFDVGGEQTYRFLKLDQSRFKPIINILVTMGKMPNGLPKATIKKEGETIATASLNWEGRYFGEIGVETKSSYRRQGYGQSVVAALCQYLIDRGKGVVFVVAAENTPSIQLAESLGFIDTHHTEHLIELTAR